LLESYNADPFQVGVISEMLLAVLNTNVSNFSDFTYPDPDNSSSTSSKSLLHSLSSRKPQLERLQISLDSMVLMQEVSPLKEAVLQIQHPSLSPGTIFTQNPKQPAMQIANSSSLLQLMATIP
jgi:hypothetical protein